MNVHWTNDVYRTNTLTFVWSSCVLILNKYERITVNSSKRSQSQTITMNTFTKIEVYFGDHVLGKIQIKMK